MFFLFVFFFYCYLHAITHVVSTLQEAPVYYGPDEITSSSTDVAFMQEHALHQWNCVPSISNPKPEVEYFVCGNPEMIQSCQKLDNPNNITATRDMDNKYLLCTATNPETGRQIANTPHEVDVQYSPVFQGKDRAILVRLGKPFELNCDHSGNPEPEFVWAKDVFDVKDAVFLSRKRRHEHHHHDHEGGAPTEAAVAEVKTVEIVAPAEAAATPAPVVVEAAVQPTAGAPVKEEEVVVEVVEEKPVMVTPDAAVAAKEEVPAAKEGGDALSEELLEVLEGTPAPAEDSTEESAEEKDEGEDDEVELKEEEKDEDNTIFVAAVTEEPTTEAAEEVPPTTMAPTTTARPLLPSVDLSGHTEPVWSVKAAEEKHFGTYVCTAKNSVGTSVIRYSVTKDTSPIVKPTTKPKGGSGNSASLLRPSSAAAAIFATLISLLLF